MTHITLTVEEKQILKAYVKVTPLLLIRLKSQAILMRSKRVKVVDIADIVSRDERTIERWTKDFSQRRIASIFTGHKDNENAGKLTRRQKQRIQEILKKPPSVYGLPKEFWDVPQLKRYIQAMFGVVYESVRSYHFLLKFSDLSFKYPATVDIHRDEKFIRKRMGEIRKEVARYLTDKQWEVFASDETRMILEGITRRAWLKKGERTVVKVERKKEAQSYLGLLNQKTFTCHMYELPWQNQGEVLKALRIFLAEYPNKRICIVWDNARFHKGISIREALRKGELLQRVHLINFPPYAPDMNPIEHVWKTVKERLANIQFETFEKTKQAFKYAVLSQAFHYTI